MYSKLSHAIQLFLLKLNKRVNVNSFSKIRPRFHGAAYSLINTHR